MGGGGTEAFPNLGMHCEHQDCNQLDFLPFTCDGCQKVFCKEHRTYREHDCPKGEQNSRMVVVCEVCAQAIEKKADEDEQAILEKHASSGSCDASKKNKPRCPVKRCKGVLTFSNRSTCKICRQDVCLRHRFPSDHLCKASPAKPSTKLLPVALPSRNGVDCRERKGRSISSPPKSINATSSPSVKAC